MSETGEKKRAPFLDESIDFIFSKEAQRLFLIVLLALILRVIVASNLTPVEDESGSITHSIGFSRLAPLSQMAQAQVWYYLSDYIYRIAGVSLLTGRFLSVVFGTLSVIVVYLIASFLFNKKTGYVAAFLLAVSAYHITWTASYQDQTMMFFVLLAIYFFITEYSKSKTISIWSAVFLAIAELVKIITGVFVLVFGFFTLGILIKNYKNDKALFRKNLKRTIACLAILSIGMTPILAYNHFLYKEKGIVDLPFAQFLRINPEFYTGPGLHHEEGFVLHKLPRNLSAVFSLYFIREDLLVFALGSLGILWLLSRLKKKNFGESFLLGIFFFALLFIASAIVLQTHYTSFFPLFAIFGGGFLVHLADSASLKRNSKKIIIAVLLLIAIFNIANVREPLTSESALQKMRTYAVEEIDENTLVVVDSRIYVGTYSWIFHDKSYVDAGHLQSLFQISNASGQVRPVKTVFIECVNDDCGWGTIKDQPDLNQTMENLVSEFAKISTIEDITSGGSITGVRGGEIKGQPFYRIYKTSLLLNPGVLQAVEQTHSHFLYHVPRDAHPEQAFDYYKVRGPFNKMLNAFAYLVLYTILLLAVVSILVPFYILVKLNDGNNPQHE